MKNTCLNLLATLVLASTGAARATAQDCQYAVGYGLQIFKSVDGSWVQVGNGMTVPPGTPIRFRGWVSVGTGGCDACCADIYFDYARGTNCPGGARHDLRYIGQMKPISADEIWEWISPTYIPDSFIVLGKFWIFEVQSGGHSEVYAPTQVCYIPCDGDVTGDLNVDVSDLITVIGGWGHPSGSCPDANHDGVVDISDLMLVIGNWGTCY